VLAGRDTQLGNGPCCRFLIFGENVAVVTKQFQTPLRFKKSLISWLHFSSWYDTEIALSFYQFCNTLVRVLVLIILGTSSAFEDADREVKLTL